MAGVQGIPPVDACKACARCCQPTQMLLGPDDLQRIAARGYDTTLVTKPSRDFPTLRILKNKPDGTCAFLARDGAGFACSIYNDRPAGCRFYPLIHDVETDTCILDKVYCPRWRDLSPPPGACAALRRYLVSMGLVDASPEPG